MGRSGTIGRQHHLPDEIVIDQQHCVRWAQPGIPRQTSQHGIRFDKGVSAEVDLAPGHPRPDASMGFVGRNQ